MKKKMHLKAILGLTIALFALAGMTGGASADPASPETFHGVVSIDGSPAPRDITIEARDSGGGLLGSTQTTGAAYFMSFSASEDGIDAPPNPPIHFWIDPDGAGPGPRYEADNNPCTNWSPESVNLWNVVGSSIRDLHTPAAVRIASFEAKVNTRSVKLTWTTGSEMDNLGFNVYRATGQGDRPELPLNREFIPSQSPGSMRGAEYAFVDDGVEPESVYRYWLEDLDMSGQATMHGPVTATVPRNSNARPANVSVTPGTVSSRPWAWTEFTMAWRDPDGVGNIRYAEALINKRASGTSGVWLRFYPASGKLLLRNPNTKRWIRVRNNRSQNPYALVELADVVQDGEQLQITYRLKAKGTFLGDWNVFLRVQDNEGLKDRWNDLGDWSVAR